MHITVEADVDAPLDNVWNAYVTPADILKWNSASDDWHTTKSTVDLRKGGVFSSRMEAKDGSFGFDFEGTYTNVVPHKLLEYECRTSCLNMNLAAAQGKSNFCPWTSGSKYG